MESSFVTKEQKKLLSNHISRSITDTSYQILKWTAIATMTVHHVGYLLFSLGAIGKTDYTACYTIGRMAFPLFCFLLVECYYHTQNRTKHLVKMAMLAVFSEIPWDYFYSGKAVKCDTQNVCFTLTLGFLMLYFMDIPVTGIIKAFAPKASENTKIVGFYAKVVRFDLFAGFLILAYLFRSDYSFYGIFLIAIFRLAHNSNHRIAWLIAGLVFHIFAKPPFDAALLFSLADLVLIIPAISEKPLPCTEHFSFLTIKAAKLTASLFFPAHLVILCAISIILSAL